MSKTLVKLKIKMHHFGSIIQRNRGVCPRPLTFSILLPVSIDSVHAPAHSLSFVSRRPGPV